MKKVLNILKRKKGMTLIELVAGMLIFTVIATSVSAVLVPALNAFMKANELAEINTLLDNLTEEMLSDIARVADKGKITIDDGKLTIATVTDSVTYYVDNDTGVLYRRDDVIADTPVLEKRYYKGKSVEIMPVDKSENPIVSGNITEPFYIQISISSDKEDSVITSRKYAVNPLGFKNYKP